ncbi:transcription factor [Methanobrevibacter cuticularis]|uniref:Transcription factor n=1 Tax=Methanobrevibacter cuticularis TaxID=47311 RepID=A0A166E3P5_9EURY|nr:multiprotein bridging factor aMBF1 [Methanobrevibacter cuticularis]KZX16245.1 transcription factor [Methanobrevibacter cuticularis]
MRCEICGKVVVDKPVRTKIDGSIMEVCQDCSKFGTIQKEPPKPKKPITNTNRPIRRQRPMYSADEPSEELIENYNSIIRQARESKGFSREELGEKIYEKVSVINRIESGKMVPDLKLAKKFEKALKIELIEKINDIDLENFKSNSSKVPTLGDIVKIKKK